MRLFAVWQLGFAIWMSLSKNKHELTDIPGDIIFSATGNTSSSVIYYHATLLCALPVTLKVCSTDRPSGTLQACSNAEDTTDKPSSSVQACSNAEDATDIPSGILQACSNAENAIEHISALVLRGSAVAGDSFSPKAHSMLSTMKD
jgi:hypothetical protein